MEKVGQADHLLMAINIINTEIVKGYCHRFRQPSLRLHVRINAPIEPELSAAGERRLSPLPEWCAVPRLLANIDLTLPAMKTLEMLIDWLARIQISAGLHLTSCGLIEAASAPKASKTGESFEALLLIPSPIPRKLREIVGPLIAALNALVDRPEVTEQMLAQCIQAMRIAAPVGVNTQHILREAYARDCPVLALPAGVYQLGWGKRSRLFRSSTTDDTGVIAVTWSRDKLATNNLLRMAGLPTPTQIEVTSIDAAINAARNIGFPVVLKPFDLDQGIGVEADLRSELELRRAYDRSAAHGRRLILERHIPGKDYRVYVVQGKVVAVAERHPAAITGDGKSTVLQLVNEINAQRQHGITPSVYKPIDLGEEAIELLERSGLNLQSVIPNGQEFRLCRLANSSRGGISIDVSSQIHPDNISLCERAASLLRLDIAGLDFIIKDIATSWREVESGFCEVNAQPQMGGAHPWIFNYILDQYIFAAARIPSVLYLTDQPSGAAEDAAKTLEVNGAALAVITAGNTELVSTTLAAVMRPDIDGLIAQTDGGSLKRMGLPLDRFDMLVIDNWDLTDQRRKLLGWLYPSIQGFVAISGNDKATNQTASLLCDLFGPARVTQVGNADQLCKWLMEWFQQVLHLQNRR